MSKNLKNLMVDLNEKELYVLLRNELKTRDPLDIFNELQKGMTEVGELFEKKEYFLTELIMSGEIFAKVMEIIEPFIKKENLKKKGKIVIGTVHGDLHDIGKNVFISLLRANGYEVEDLGVDVAPEKFLESLNKIQPDFLGLSGLLTLAFEPMKKTIELIKHDYKKNVIIIVGGGHINTEWGEQVGADLYTNNAAKGIKMLNETIRKKK